MDLSLGKASSPGVDGLVGSGSNFAQSDEAAPQRTGISEELSSQPPPSLPQRSLPAPPWGAGLSGAQRAFFWGCGLHTKVELINNLRGCGIVTE